MNHEDYKEKLSALLDGELDDATRADVLTHLDGCEVCRAYLAELTALRGALGDLEDVDAPEGFADGVLARLHAEKETKKRAPWRVWGALAACAAVVVLAVTSLPRMGGASPDGAAITTTIAESAYDSAAVDYGAVEEAAPAEAETAAEPTEEKSLYLTHNAAAEPERAAGTAADEPPTLTLTGAGAADWLMNNGWQGESGDWYADAALLRALPEGLAADEAPPEGYDGAVRVEVAS